MSLGRVREGCWTSAPLHPGVAVLRAAPSEASAVGSAGFDSSSGSPVDSADARNLDVDVLIVGAGINGHSGSADDDDAVDNAAGVRRLNTRLPAESGITRRAGTPVTASVSVRRVSLISSQT